MAATDRVNDNVEEVVCAGCRQGGPRADFERFVFHDTVGLVYDMRGGAPGREVFVHPLASCIRAAAWAGFARHLGEPLRELDGDDLVEAVRDGLAKDIGEQLFEAQRLGLLQTGRSAVERASHAGELELVLVDAAAGHSVRREADKIDDDADVAVFDDIPERLLGSSLGSEVVIVGLPPGTRAERLGRTVEKFICMIED